MIMLRKRLVTDAKIVLERAGYFVGVTPLVLQTSGGDLAISHGTVDNSEVIRLLSARGYNEYGHPMK